jgi:hypothetical protein
VRTEPAWFKPTVERLKHLLQLREDWDSYGAAPVDPRAARKALQLLALTTSLATPAPAVVPTVRGGLQLEWHQPDVDLEVEVPPSGPLRMTYENFVEGREWEGELRSNLAPLVEALAQLSRRG